MTYLTQDSTTNTPLTAFLDPLAHYASTSRFKFIPTVQKRPVLTDWANNASNDPIQLKKWKNDYPGSGLGIPTGQRNGIVVIDIDCKSNANGYDSWQSLINEHANGIQPDTYAVSTPSGGLHLYFSIPEHVEIKNSVSLIGTGIDIRGDGGQVISVWSRNPDGGIYEPATDTTDIIPVPEWLLVLLINKTQNINKPKCFTNGKIAEGGRNQNLCRILGRVVN